MYALILYDEMKIDRFVDEKDEIKVDGNIIIDYEIQ